MGLKIRKNLEVADGAGQYKKKQDLTQLSMESISNR